MYGYYSKIQWEIENDSPEGKVPSANNRVKQLQAARDNVTERLNPAVATQTKHYNKTHQPQRYKVGNLVMLATKNLKQKRPSKKLSHKFVGLFRIVDKVGAQAYQFLLLSKYRIHNTFHVSLLEPYHLRNCGNAAKVFMQALKLINDDKLWEVEEIVDKVKNWEGVWCWSEEYNQWLSDKELKRASKLTQAYKQAGTKRKHQEEQQETIVTDNIAESMATRRSKQQKKKQN